MVKLTVAISCQEGASSQEAKVLWNFTKKLGAKVGNNVYGDRMQRYTYTKEEKQ